MINMFTTDHENGIISSHGLSIVQQHTTRAPSINIARVHDMSITLLPNIQALSSVLVNSHINDDDDQHVYY